MKKINLRGISEILSEKELKNVVGGGSNSGTGGSSGSGGSGGVCSSSTCSGTCGNYQKYVDGSWVNVTMYCISGLFGYCGCG